MIVGVLSFRGTKTNPYETSKDAIAIAQSLRFRLRLRLSTFGMAALAGIGNTSAALIDAYREGYPTLDGYLFIGITTMIPWMVGVIGMLLCFMRPFPTYCLWSVGTFVALLPGLFLWTVCAAMPSPRIHTGAGQMHIFFLPVIHIGYSFLVYLGTALLGVVVTQNSKP